jgi:membrane-bound lytic murein transglycosylase B
LRNDFFLPTREAMRNIVLFFGVVWMVMLSSTASYAERPLQPFIQELRAKARSEGVSDALLDKVFDGFTVSHQAIAADKQQPEDTFRFTKYKNNVVSPARVQRGRTMLAKHRAVLEKVAKEYGVPAKYIVALWGTETDYGGYTGGHNIPRALASLAYEGRREAFFTDEFIASLKIIEQGHIGYEQMQGSWAGAMGQCQFMPSSFFKFAVDYDGDGHKNIWTSHADVFASIANYLKQSGWKEEERWGRQVKLLAGFDLTQENINGFFPISHWRTQGMRFADGSEIPKDSALQAAFMLPSIVLKDGIRTNMPSAEEGAFLVYPNYHVFLKWNFSRLFATAVGLLADEIGK